jgi:hypothetical protein
MNWKSQIAGTTVNLCRDFIPSKLPKQNRSPSGIESRPTVVIPLPRHTAERIFQQARLALAGIERIYLPLGFLIPELSSFAVPFNSLRIILRNALTVFIHQAEIVLR